MPRQRAEYKAKSMGRSVAFFALGAVCIAGAFAFVVWTMRETKGAPSIPVLLFAAVPLVAGGYFLFAGGNILSAEAMDAAGETGNVVVRTAAKALRLARPKI
jgi:hypothetical protein